MDNPPPWYRQFWPWFIFSLPAIVVVAGLTTVWIAMNNADDLVADEYYKKGLAVNREIAKQTIARQLGVLAQLEAEQGLMRVKLQGKSRPAALLLLLSHPFDADQDASLRLPQVNSGIYEAAWKVDAKQRWLWHLEPLAVSSEEHWRIDGELTIIPANEH